MDEQYNTNQSSTVINQEPSSDDRLMGTLIYVLSFFTSLIAPLIIWLIVASIAMFIIIGFILFPIIAILNFIFTIVAAVKAYNGEDYLPPLSIRFFK